MIPALAEIFGVTCDELLKGERIFAQPRQEKSELKVEKQLKAIVHRAISSFKMVIWISLALSAVGFVCMLGISYGFFRPVIGFAVMMLFETAAFTMTTIGVNKMKEAKRENELFENADITLINRYNGTLGVFSYIAFFSILSVIALSLPFLFFLSDYVDSVLAFDGYLQFFVMIAFALVLLFFALKEIYCARITGQPHSKTGKNTNPKRKAMDILQLGALALASILILISAYFEKPNSMWTISDTLCVGALALTIANIIIFIVYLLRFRSDRKELVLSGIRNLLMIIPTILTSRIHSAAFAYIGESIIEDAAGLENLQYERSDIWHFEYFWLAIGLTLFIFTVFKLIEIMIKRKSK